MDNYTAVILLLTATTLMALPVDVSRRRTSPVVVHQTRRPETVELLDVVGERETPTKNCSRTVLHVADSKRYFHGRHVGQLQMATRLVSLVQNTMAMMVNQQQLKKRNQIGYYGRLYGSFAKAMVEMSTSVCSCVIYVRLDDDGQEDDEGQNVEEVVTTTATTTSSTVPLELIPYAYRRLGAGDVSLKDLSDNNASATERSPGEPLWRTIVANYRDVFDNGTELVNQTHVPLNETWESPWFDCLERRWLVTFTLPLVLDNRWRGAMMVTSQLSQMDVNQCAESDWLFGDTHLCDRHTMQCVHRAGGGFRRGSYECVCRAGFYFPNDSDASTRDGEVLEVLLGRSHHDAFRCLPCRPGCTECDDVTPCYVEYNLLIRGVPLGLQSFCMTITVVLGVCIFQLRKCKVIATGMWTVLEMILVGAFCIYSTVVIRYFEPLTLGCLLEPWLREMGFAICYGTIVLKLYRILVEFRTRKAHRWVIRDKDLLKYLMGIILVVVAYMSAWTAISIDHLGEGDSLVDVGLTDQGLKYAICKSRWWEYVTEIGEFVFLAFAISITYHIRNASSHYNEKVYLCLSIYIEAVVSSALYIFRHGVWLTLHPDYIFLLYFARCQLTVSITLVLVFGPKFWYHYRPPVHDSAEGDHGKTSKEPEAPGPDRGLAAEMLKLSDGITSNGEVDIGEINLADMDPEDIRAELRRVYTQLQILRNKTMRKDNPHISKRRGGRKATHRRFSLQDVHVTPSTKNKKNWERKEWF